MWTCEHCGEKSEDTFDSCWKCGTGKDGTPETAAMKEAISSELHRNVEAREKQKPPYRLTLGVNASDRRLNIVLMFFVLVATISSVVYGLLSRSEATIDQRIFFAIGALIFMLFIPKVGMQLIRILFCLILCGLAFIPAERLQKEAMQKDAWEVGTWPMRVKITQPSTWQQQPPPQTLSAGKLNMKVINMNKEPQAPKLALSNNLDSLTKPAPALPSSDSFLPSSTVTGPLSNATGRDDTNTAKSDSAAIQDR